MARPSVNEDRKKFLQTLRRKKILVGNTALRNELGWKEDRYWKVHASLSDEGLIIRGRGRGGTVGRVLA